MDLILAFLVWIGLVGREPPAPPAPEPAVVEAETVRPPVYPHPPVIGGPPEPPGVLPAARSCKEGVGEVWRRKFDVLPGQVNGALVKGAQGLRRLRRDWKDALVIVRGGDFSGADLRGLRLHNLCFVDSNFTGSDWRNVHAPGIGFLWSDLTGARMRRARMPHILIENPFLARVDATGADLSDGVLAGDSTGSSEGLRLDRANLRRFRVDCGIEVGNQCFYRSGASLRGADLRDAHIDTFWGVDDWTDARLDRTQISLWQLVELGEARLRGPVIVREGKATAAFSPAEISWLRRHVRERQPEKPMKGVRPPGMGPGTVALFAAPPIALDAAVRAKPIYRRLSPVLVMGASSVLLVEVRKNGRIDVHGSAVGGNAHSCSLGGRNLRFDHATGWFLGEDQGDDGGTGARPPDRPVPVVAFSAGRVDVYERGRPSDEKDRGFSHFGLCGTRAAFDRMIRIPLSPARAKRLFETWG